jgi:hypothetical protein
VEPVAGGGVGNRPNGAGEDDIDPTGVANALPDDDLGSATTAPGPDFASSN